MVVDAHCHLFHIKLLLLSFKLYTSVSRGRAYGVTWGRYCFLVLLTSIAPSLACRKCTSQKLRRGKEKSFAP